MRLWRRRQPVSAPLDGEPMPPENLRPHPDRCPPRQIPRTGPCLVNVARQHDRPHRHVAMVELWDCGHPVKEHDEEYCGECGFPEYVDADGNDILTDVILHGRHYAAMPPGTILRRDWEKS